MDSPPLNSRGPGQIGQSSAGSAIRVELLDAEVRGVRHKKVSVGVYQQACRSAKFSGLAAGKAADFFKKVPCGLNF